MLGVYTSVTTAHDWHLVLLAAAIGLLASAATIGLFHRAKAKEGHAQIIWLSLDAITAGCGFWATHFVAMLGYSSAIGVGYDHGLTFLSLLVAVLISGLGLAIALKSAGRAAAIGGAVIGGGISAMHYIGVLALELPSRIIWSPNLVAASVALGIGFGSLALFVAARREGWANRNVSMTLRHSWSRVY